MNSSITPFVPAIVTLIGTLIVVFCSTFVAENYRRFRDRAALAAAIAGELESYREAWKITEDNLNRLIEITGAGKTVDFPKMEKPTDRIFDSCVEKIGLLGHKLVEDITYVYGNINGFRISMSLAAIEGYTAQQQNSAFNVALQMQKRTYNRGIDLVDKLKKCADENYYKNAVHIFIAIAILITILGCAFFAGLSTGKSSENLGKIISQFPSQSALI